MHYKFKIIESVFAMRVAEHEAVEVNKKLLIVVYSINDKAKSVKVLSIAHRKDVYR